MIEQSLTNSTVTTTVLQQTSGAVFLGLPVTDWIAAGAGVVVAFFAYVTVREARRNRRKDMVEKMLENVYSPLYDILRRAKFAEHREMIRQSVSQREYVLTEEEFVQVRGIIERFGYYLGGQERMAITNVLEQEHDLFIDPRVTAGRYYRWRLVDIEKHWVFLWKTSEDLRRELEELTRRKRKTWRENLLGLLRVQPSKDP